MTLDWEQTTTYQSIKGGTWQYGHDELKGHRRHRYKTIVNNLQVIRLDSQGHTDRHCNMSEEEVHADIWTRCRSDPGFLVAHLLEKEQEFNDAVRSACRHLEAGSRSGIEIVHNLPEEPSIEWWRTCDDYVLQIHTILQTVLEYLINASDAFKIINKLIALRQELSEDAIEDHVVDARHASFEAWIFEIIDKLIDDAEDVHNMLHLRDPHPSSDLVRRFENDLNRKVCYRPELRKTWSPGYPSVFLPIRTSGSTGFCVSQCEIGSTRS